MLEYSHVHLVGIKGVAMTSLAQLLTDAGITVSGSDVAESFVTQPVLDALHLEIQTGFEHQLPDGCDCVVYTSAHQSHRNAQVQAAKKIGLPTFSHAEALGKLANTQSVVAVCGVGGKTTTSGMLVWIADQTRTPISFSVGAGSIRGLERTGIWNATSEYFVTEADEYVENPEAHQDGEAIKPRFLQLHPSITVCTNLKFDHPDVYRDFAHTRQVFRQFFSQLKPGGTLIYNADDPVLTEEVAALSNRHQITAMSFGFADSATLRISEYLPGMPSSSILTHVPSGDRLSLTLQLPGEHNHANAAAALLASMQMGIPLDQAASGLHSFRSVERRFETVSTRDTTVFLDDYGHHPDELAACIRTFIDCFPDRKRVVAFQPHTYTRTAELFDAFVSTLSSVVDELDELLIVDIFASARESKNTTVNAAQLAEAVRGHTRQATHIGGLKELTKHFQALPSGTAAITIGAGDIYQIYKEVLS